MPATLRNKERETLLGQRWKALSQDEKAKYCVGEAAYYIFCREQRPRLPSGLSLVETQKLLSQAVCPMCRPGLLGRGSLGSLPHSAHGATVSSCQSRRSYTTFQTPQARHGRTSPRLRSRRAKAASWWCNSSLLWPPRAGTPGSWLRCPRGTNCSEGPTVCCGAAERPEVADLLKVLDAQEKARYKVGGATCSNPYNVTGRRTRTCGWDPTICRAADPACSLVPSQLFRQHQRWLLPPSLSNAQRERRLSAMWKAHPFATPQCSRAPTSS